MYVAFVLKRYKLMLKLILKLANITLVINDYLDISVKYFFIAIFVTIDGNLRLYSYKIWYIV